MTDMVHVLVYTHRPGEDIFVHATEAGLRKTLAAVVGEYWHEVADSPARPDAMPADTDEAIRIYFEANNDESYSIEVKPLLD